MTFFVVSKMMFHCFWNRKGVKIGTLYVKRMTAFSVFSVMLLKIKAWERSFFFDKNVGFIN